MAQKKSKTKPKVAPKAKKSKSKSAKPKKKLHRVPPPAEEKKPLTVAQSVAKKYGFLKQFVKGICDKKLPGLLVFGERGLGKTYTIQEVVDQYLDKRDVTKLSGHISPAALYNKLAENREEDCIIWFDDCDSVFLEKEAMNILKAAMDTLPKRIVSWTSTSKLITEPEFEFKGRIIFTTNIVVSQNPHLAALLDRIHWAGMALTLEEKMFKIAEIAKYYEAEVDAATVEAVVQWLKDNLNKIGKLLSLRTFVKCVQLAQFSPDWPELAETMIAQDVALSKQMEDEVLSKLSTKGGKRGSRGASRDSSDKVKSYDGNYRPGSMIQKLFDELASGGTYSMDDIRAMFSKDERSQIPSVIARLMRHGKKSGVWTVEEIRPEVYQFKKT